MQHMQHIISTIREGEKTRNRQMDGNPNLVFDIGDVVKTPNMLSRLVRLICYRERITHGMLDNALRERMERMGGSSKSLSYAKPNLMKAIKAERVTFEKAIELFQQILGFNVDVSITLTRPGEEPHVYEFSTAMRELTNDINQRSV
jgi:hypothetical protein